MKEYIDQIINRLDRANKTQRPLLERRIFSEDEVIGIVTIALKEKITKGVRLIPAHRLNSFLSLIKKHGPSDNVDMALGCILLKIKGIDKNECYWGESIISPQIAKDVPEGTKIAKPPCFVMKEKAAHIDYDYTSLSSFSWGDMEHNALANFPTDTENLSYVDIEYFLASIIGDDILFNAFIPYVIAYLSYFLRNTDEIPAWKQETHEKLKAIHKTAISFQITKDSNITLH